MNMMDTNKTELKQVILELQNLKVRAEKGEKIKPEIDEIVVKVKRILNTEQCSYVERTGAGGVVEDEKLNALFSANAYLNANAKLRVEVIDNISKTVEKLQICTN